MKEVFVANKLQQIFSNRKEKNKKNYSANYKQG